MLHFVQRIKNLFKKGTDKATAVVATALATVVMSPELAFASGTITKKSGNQSDVVNGIGNLATLLTTIAQAAGAVVLLWGIIKFGISFTKQDQGGEHTAINWIIAGIVMLVAGTIVKYIQGQ